MREPPELDPVIHGRLRLAILSILGGAEEAEFTYLRERTGATDGNLSANLAKLEGAGYVAVKKLFVDRKPRSLYRMTEKGRTAFARYVRNLKTLIGREI